MNKYKMENKLENINDEKDEKNIKDIDVYNKFENEEKDVEVNFVNKNKTNNDKEELNNRINNNLEKQNNEKFEIEKSKNEVKSIKKDSEFYNTEIGSQSILKNELENIGTINNNEVNCKMNYENKKTQVNNFKENEIIKLGEDNQNINFYDTKKEKQNLLKNKLENKESIDKIGKEEINSKIYYENEIEQINNSRSENIKSEALNLKQDDLIIEQYEKNTNSTNENDKITSKEKLKINIKDENDFFNIVDTDINYEVKRECVDLLRNLLGNNYNIFGLNEKKKKELIDIYDTIYRHKQNRRLNYRANGKYFDEICEYLKGIKIIGDSQVGVLSSYNLNSVFSEKFIGFKGINIKDMVDYINSDILINTKCVILFNGCNIGIFKSSEEYVDAYNNIIKKIKSINGDIEIFITSLLPATEIEILKDAESPVFHQYYRTGEFDNAIKNEFTKDGKLAHYIDTNWIVNDDMYVEDGLHFNPEFYKTYLPYVLKFISFVYE